MGHLLENGFEVDARDITGSQLAALKAEKGVAPDLEGCHTAEIEGYTVEGHVPADLIKRLLAERPEGVIGLSVPGMPVGSPGMEGPNPQPYDVIAFDADGGTRVYDSR